MAVPEYSIVLDYVGVLVLFFFSSRRRHTRCLSDWSSDVCSSDLPVNDHRAVEQGSVAVLGGLEASDELGEEAQVVGLDLRQLGQRGRIVAVVRELEIGRASCRERV